MVDFMRQLSVFGNHSSGRDQYAGWINLSLAMIANAVNDAQKAKDPLEQLDALFFLIDQAPLIFDAAGIESFDPDRWFNWIVQGMPKPKEAHGNHPRL
jgi:hypothetical protein